jgi:hypothetical protein
VYKFGTSVCLDGRTACDDRSRVARVGDTTSVEESDPEDDEYHSSRDDLIMFHYVICLFEIYELPTHLVYY